MNQTFKDLARLHMSALHDSFLNNFGVNFLAIIYESVAKNPDNIVVIFRKKDRLIGFAVATRNPDNFMKKVILDCLVCHLIDSIITIISRPFVAISAVFWQFFDKKPSPKPELQFIAIDEGFRNKGLGRKLISELALKEFIVGTKSNNLLSNNFYKKLGYKHIGIYTAFGEPLNYYLAKYLKKKDPLSPKN